MVLFGKWDAAIATMSLIIQICINYFQVNAHRAYHRPWFCDNNYRPQKAGGKNKQPLMPFRFVFYGYSAIITSDFAAAGAVAGCF